MWIKRYINKKTYIWGFIRHESYNHAKKLIKLQQTPDQIGGGVCFKFNKKITEGFIFFMWLGPHWKPKLYEVQCQEVIKSIPHIPALRQSLFVGQAFHFSHENMMQFKLKMPVMPETEYFIIDVTDIRG